MKHYLDTTAVCVDEEGMIDAIGPILCDGIPGVFMSATEIIKSFKKTLNVLDTFSRNFKVKVYSVFMK